MFVTLWIICTAHVEQSLHILTKSNCKVLLESLCFNCSYYKVLELEVSSPYLQTILRNYYKHFCAFTTIQTYSIWFLSIAKGC